MDSFSYFYLCNKFGSFCLSNNSELKNCRENVHMRERGGIYINKEKAGGETERRLLAASNIDEDNKTTRAGALLKKKPIKECPNMKVSPSIF